ncbi:MAG: GNAT family N-acetyltransferase [bacterium]
MIKEIIIEYNIEQLTQLIRKSFITVAQDFGLTRSNAPTNPAFIDSEQIIESVSNKDIKYYGIYKNAKLIGCYALENAGNAIYYLERLAVIPEERHKGIGSILVLDALKRLRNADGKKVSIGIINKHKILKNWYKSLGFTEVGEKDYPHLPFRVCYLEYCMNKEMPE